MIDRDIGGRDEHRLGMRQHVKAMFPVVMAHAGRSDAPERHRLDEEMDIDLVDRAAAKRQFADEAVDRLLISAEDEGSQRMRGCGDPAEGLVAKGPPRLLCHCSQFGICRLFGLRGATATESRYTEGTHFAEKFWGSWNKQVRPCEPEPPHGGSIVRMSHKLCRARTVEGM